MQLDNFKQYGIPALNSTSYYLPMSTPVSPQGIMQ